MKKLKLLIIITFIANTGWSQVIFQEDFDGIAGPTAGGAGTYTFPTGWLLRNVDNMTPNSQVAYINEAWERREDFQNSVLDSVAFSSSWGSPIQPANDWMWTPLIGPLPANTELSWNAKAYDPLYPDGYEVRIMTSTQGPPTGGTGVIGNQIVSSTVLFSTAAENSTWTSRSVDLNAFAGQSVYIGFRNNSTDKFILVIDDVMVQVLSDYDANLTSTTIPSEYSQVPVNQTPSFVIQGVVYNDGSETLTNVTLNANVFDSDLNNVYTASSAPTTIASGANATLTVPNFVASFADTFTIEYSITSTEVDENLVNNEATRSVVVTDSTYARDLGAITGALGIGAGNGGYLGNEFEILNADELTSITVTYNQGYVGKQYALAVWNMVGGVPSTIIAGTDTLLYPDNLGGTFTLPVQGYPTLNPGSYVVTAIEFDSTVSVAQTNDLFTNDRTWVWWPTIPSGNWGNNEDFGANYAKPYVIRPNFGPSCQNANNTIDTVLCFGGSIIVNSVVYNQSGNYTEIVTVGECDSTINLNLTILDEINDNITLEADQVTISVNAIPGASYQWFNCSDDTEVNGETNNSFTTTSSGEYYVTITLGTCEATSDCFTVDELSVEGLELVNFDVYPNPANAKIEIISSEQGDFEIQNELGQTIISFRLNANETKSINVTNYAAGLYFIKNKTTNSSTKLIIE